MLYKVHYDGIIQQYVETDSDTVETEDEIKEFMKKNVHYGGMPLDRIVKIEPMYRYMVSLQSTTTRVGSIWAASEDEAKKVVKSINFKNYPFWKTHNKVEGKRKHIRITKEEN